MLWVQIGIAVVGVIVIFFIVMGQLGRRLPEEHTASLTLRLNQPQQQVQLHIHYPALTAQADSN